MNEPGAVYRNEFGAMIDARRPIALPCDCAFNQDLA